MVHLFIKYEFHYLPESIALVLLGFIVGGILFILNLFGYDYQYQETFSPQFFFLVLLPPIIFESGYSLHKGNFFQNLGSIMMFAVFGTAISAVIVGGGVYLLGLMGVVYKLDLIQSFTFGSLISAVDPVATLAIFHALHVDPTLNMLVFGESVLNDAVSIVLTKTILNQLPPSGNVTAVEASAAQVLGNSSWQFCVMFFGSALLGVAFALISALFLKLVNLRRHQSLEFSMWVIFAFAPYFLAEGLHLSGIMTVLFCGIVMSHYTHYNLSAVTQITVQQSLRTVAFMAESGVFLYLGMAVFSINKSFDLALIIWSIVLILIGRAANIFPLTFLMNCCRSVKISLRMQCIMWYSGLRGAVAFALAENLREYFDDKVTGYIVTTTLIIVLFTIVILGGSTLPLLKFLKADKGAKLTLSKTEEQDLAISRATIEETFTKSSYRRLKDCSQGFMYMDYNYIRPLFIRRFTREVNQFINTFLP
jgi:sodium/hydrogen exchanger 8